jgi:hypothetical protein
MDREQHLHVLRVLADAVDHFLSGQLADADFMHRREQGEPEHKNF